MERAKPVWFLSAVVCLLLGIFPWKAWAQSAPTCLGSADTNQQGLFGVQAFVEFRNAQFLSASEIAFTNIRQEAVARSVVLSKEIPVNLADDYTISRVVFEKSTLNTNCNACPTCELIEFQISLNCNTCVRNANGTVTCVQNSQPQWITLGFNPADIRKRVELDTLGMGFIGSQLCWRARLTAKPTERPDCRPTFKNIYVGYQAVKSGEYSRSSPMPVANMAFLASYITPRSQFDSEVSSRAVTNLKDYSRRGMVRAYELYDPEFPEKTTKKLRWSLKSGISTPDFLDHGGVRYHQKGPLQTQGTWAPLELDVFDEYFSLEKCKTPENILLYDLNRSNSCDNKDPVILKNWLIGLDADGALRAYGAIPTAFDLSTPAFISMPVAPPPWVRMASQAEINNYRLWNGGRKSSDKALLWLGSTTGEIYGIDAGTYYPDEQDGCLTSVRHHRGYFQPLPGCPKNTDGSLKRYTGELEWFPGVGKVKTVYRPWTFRANYIYEYNTKYYGTEYQSRFSVLRPSINASLSFVDVDFMSPQMKMQHDFENPNLPLTWELDQGLGYRPKGGHSLIAISSGPNQSLFQTIFSGRDERLYYLWELDFKTNKNVQEFFDNASQYFKPAFNRNSSRHTPLTGRFMFNKPTPSLEVGIAKWMAVVGSDYHPGVDGAGRLLAGAIYFIDLYTGELMDLSSYIPGPNWVGLTLLEPGEGVGGEIVGLDLQNQSVERPKPETDGIYDVIYIPTTFGRVYRLNLLKYDNNSNDRFGDPFSKCKIIDIPEILGRVSNLNSEDLKRQGIYSNLAVYKDGKTVRIYVGTADNPDIYDKEIDPPAAVYYVLAFELDESSVGTAACTPAKPLWIRELPPGEKVWGGISVAAKEIVVGTATGGSSDICGLDSKTQGNLYVLASTTGELNQPPKAGQIVAPPVAFDGHYLYVDAENNFEIIASEGVAGWNNNPEGSQSIQTSSMKLLEQSFEQDIRQKKPSNTP
ncbi:MAG: hypothetical protein FWD46_02630 [Cystobacterineae bacterium]|nr:hypothetical protein [Cystobacterineae bacterium]